MRRKYYCCIFRSLQFLNRLLKQCDHHVRSSSGISVTWGTRYKQLMYLWSTDVPSDLLMVPIPEASQRFLSHWPPPQSSTQGNIDPIHLRLLDKTRMALSLGFPLSPGSRTPRSGREVRAKHSPSILSVLRAAGAVPWKHQQNTKDLLEMMSTPMSTILGKNLSPLPPEQSYIFEHIWRYASLQYSLV